MTIETPELERLEQRRSFIKKAAAGTVIAALGGGLYRLVGDDLTRKARAQTRPDGRRRLPPGQRVIRRLKPMGGHAGDSKTKNFRLKVSGEVEKPFTIDFAELLKMRQQKLALDVHCVTGWSMLGGVWSGVSLKDLADRAKLKNTARHVIFVAHRGYSANVRLRDALKPGVMVTYRLDGRPLARRHGAPVRALVPDLYFWKSAKWLKEIRFVKRDRPGYWETRGYHNRADPWKEERHG